MESSTNAQLILSAHFPLINVNISSPCVENSFGPFSECRFDFTLLFEQWILSSVPSFLFLIAASFRLASLYKENQKADGRWLQVLKFVRLLFEETFLLS